MSLSVEGALRRRGWRVGRYSPLDKVLLPRSEADPASLDRYYEDLRHYHFRRLLQEAAEQRVLSQAAVRKLENRWQTEVVAHTFNRLVEYGFLDRARRTLIFTAPKIRTFGATLEWFVAQVLSREFLAPAEWDVRLRETQRGGDFDVVTVIDGRLGYVECKGSPPYNISVDALAQFLDRTRRLAPDFAVLLVDTTLRINRNIIDNLVHLVRPDRAFMHPAEGVWELREMRPLFVVTSHRSLVANVGRCLRLFYTRQLG